MNLRDSTPKSAASERRIETMLATADEVAAMLGVSTRTVWRLLSSGQLVEPVRLGGSVRWRLDEVRQWINNGCVRESSE